MTADRPLTRRELRALERARETGSAPAQEHPAPEDPALGGPAQDVAPQPAPAEPAPQPAPAEPAPQPLVDPAPEPPSAAAPQAVPSRRALRDVARDLGTTSERNAVRRRPVQAPTTTGITVVDAATGAISAVPLAAQEEPPAPVAAAVAAPAPAPAPTPEPALEPAAETAPEEPDARLHRRSVLGRGEDSVVAPPEPAPEMPEEDVQEGARRSALATILRFLVMLLAAFVIGALIWTVADDPAAASDGVSQATSGAP